MIGFLRRLFAIPSILELREELHTTRRELKGTQDDLLQLEERFHRLHGRLAKRGELAAAEVESSGTPPQLTGRALTLQEQILARRGNRGISR